MEIFDVLVIGGGPGGYTAAIRASQLGLKTAVVEKESLGGTCLNWGCIPTKSLLRNAEVIHLLSKGRTFGFRFDNLEVDYAAAHRWSRSVVSRQNKRVAFLMKDNGIAVYEGSARFKSSQEVEISPLGETLGGRNIIIATGAKPRQLPGVPDDGDKVLNFRKALGLTKLPASAVIVGAGPIGMEFATLWNRYGVKVTVVELLDRILPLEDEEISVEAQKQFKRNGIAMKTGAVVERVNLAAGGLEVTVDVGGEKETIVADALLAVIGFTPNIDGLDLNAAGVAVTGGKIEVDDRMCTGTPHIFAVGDVNGRMGLAHVASAQGVIAAEAIAGKQTRTLNYHNVPRCTYAHPEIASVGLTEKQAHEQGHEVITALCPFVANGRALAMDDNGGFVKIVAQTGSKKILGVHLIGGHVAELVAGAAGMLDLERSAADLGDIVHPHPTLSEALMEAAQGLCGQAIHI